MHQDVCSTLLTVKHSDVQINVITACYKKSVQVKSSLLDVS